MFSNCERNYQAVVERPPWQQKRQGLVSLLDILMWLRGDYLFRLASLLRGTAAIYGPEETIKQRVLDDRDRAKAKDRLREWRDMLEKLGARGPVATIGRWQTGLDDPQFSWADMRTVAKELYSRTEDELAETLLWIIPAERALQFRQRAPFGDEVASHFSPANGDIGDAAYCLLLGRGTATVFHLMRVMEVGLRALGASLDDPGLDPKTNPTWERILARGDKELQKPLRNLCTSVSVVI